jgi:hypothetical protein
MRWSEGQGGQLVPGSATRAVGVLRAEGLVVTARPRGSSRSSPLVVVPVAQQLVGLPRRGIVGLADLPDEPGSDGMQLADRPDGPARRPPQASGRLAVIATIPP